MALNSSGPISLGGTTAGQSIQIELNGTGTTTISLNDTSVRTLAGVPSGAIEMPTNFWGKSNTFYGTIASDQTNLNLRTWALANGWNGAANAVITINSGVNVYSTSTSTAALSVIDSWPNGVALINNGSIVGKGGAGATGTDGLGNRGTAGGGGTALTVSVPITITNNNNIAGGGGGGGGGGSYNFQGQTWAGGGGGGGAGFGAGGAGGIGNTRNGSPGSAGSISGGGAGGAGGGGNVGGAGGAGGGWGSTGQNGSPSPQSGFANWSPGAAGGAAVIGNAYITWVATGNRYGTIS